MTTTPNPGPTRAPRGVGIDSRIDEAALRAPAASREDYHPQAILKFQPRNSFDYWVRYEPKLISRNIFRHRYLKLIWPRINQATRDDQSRKGPFFIKIIPAITLSFKQRHFWQYFVLILGPQQSPPSKVHSMLLMLSLQHPSPTNRRSHVLFDPKI